MDKLNGTRGDKYSTRWIRYLPRYESERRVFWFLTLPEIQRDDTLNLPHFTSARPREERLFKPKINIWEPFSVISVILYGHEARVGITVTYGRRFKLIADALTRASVIKERRPRLRARRPRDDTWRLACMQVYTDAYTRLGKEMGGKIKILFDEDNRRYRGPDVFAVNYYTKRGATTGCQDTEYYPIRINAK